MSGGFESKLVIVVDDDASLRRALERLMRSGGLATRTFASGEELIEELDQIDPACAVVDVHLPGINGLGVQRELRRRLPGLPVFLITGNDEPDTRRRALAAGAAGFFFKPFPEIDLVNAVLAAIDGRGEQDASN